MRTTSCGPASRDEPAANGATAAGAPDRIRLPIAEPAPASITELDARDATGPPRFEVKAPEAAPNAAFGKHHETAPREVLVLDPYDRWPTRSGFGKFCGFIGGETNQWAPAIFDGTVRIEVPHRPGYHFTTDMTDQAINWVSAQKALTPEKPFFIYFAPGATHAPHHVPKEWIARYRGKFAQGWDKLREETLERQKQMGVIPPDAKLTPRPGRSRPGTA
jgi:arylsulfatase